MTCPKSRYSSAALLAKGPLLVAREAFLRLWDAYVDAVGAEGAEDEEAAAGAAGWAVVARGALGRDGPSGPVGSSFGGRGARGGGRTASCVELGSLVVSAACLGGRDLPREGLEGGTPSL